MIRIELREDQVRCGESVAGQVVWNAEGGGKQPRKIEVHCRWRLEGKGRSRTEVVGQAVELDMANRSQATIPLDFRIPYLGPLSYDGKLFRVLWEVVARVDLPFARDEVEVKAVMVRPALWSPEMLEKLDALDEDDGWDEDDEV